MHLADHLGHAVERGVGGVDDHVDPVAEDVSSGSVTSAATSISASRPRSRPVISQSIQTRRSFTRPAYALRSGVVASTTRAATGPAQRIAAGYATEGGALELGTVVVDGQVDPAAQVRIRSRR